MNTSTTLEAQVVYFAFKSNQRSGNAADYWAYVCLPITIDHLEVAAPTLPDNITENFDETKRQFLGYLSDLCDEGGAMEGWYLNVAIHVLFTRFGMLMIFFSPTGKFIRSAARWVTSLQMAFGQRSSRFEDGKRTRSRIPSSGQ